MFDSRLMSAILSRHQPRVTHFRPVASGIIRVLDADPRRFFVRFIASAGVTNMPIIVPGPPPDTLPAIGSVDFTAEWKFNECPYLVTGEFYGNWFAGAECLIVENLYTGE